MGEILVRDLDPRVRKQFDNARVAVDRGNFEYAVEICSNLLLEFPGCLEARQLLRQAQQSVFANRRRGIAVRARNAFEASALVVYGQPYLKKDPKVAMAYGEKALARDPLHKGALSLVAAGAEVLDLHETAVFCLRKICDRETTNFELMRRFCEALIRTGETNEAVAIAERLKQLKPESGFIQELMKSASVAHSINKGKWAEEERDFRSKLKDGSRSESLERENRLLQDQSTASLKARDLVESIHRDPQNLDLYKRLVKAYLYADDYRSALSWLDKASLLPQAESDLGLKQMRSEVTIKATEIELQRLQREIGEHPKDREKSRQRIEALERELDALRMEEARKMVEQFPNDYAQRLKFGELLLKADRVDEAIKEFQVSQRSTSLKQRSSVLLGRSFFRKGLYDLALEQFDRSIKGAVAMDDFKKDVLYVSAECCERLGNKTEAMRRYKEIYASDIAFRDVASKVDRFYSDGDPGSN